VTGLRSDETELDDTDDAAEPTAEAGGSGYLARVRDSRWLVPGLLVAGFVANVAWRLWLAEPLATPVVLGDESRYMVFARVLAGGPGGWGGDTEATRRVGYALLVSPMYWFTNDPFTVYRLVQGLNAVLNALAFPLAYLFARRVLVLDRGWSLGTAVAAASLPAVAFFAPFALPNAVLTPLLLGWLLTLHGWMVAKASRSRLFLAAASGAVIGFMYVVHVRALLLLVVHAAVALGLVVFRRARLVELLASAAGAGVTMLLNPILVNALRGKVVTGGSEPEDRMVSAFTTVDGILRTVSDGAGQIWYLAVATWGLAAIGLVLVGYRLATRRDLPWATAVVLAATLASTVFIAVVTSAALPDDGKVNNHFYPGYIIFLAPVWVMAGLAGLRDAGWRLAAVTGARAAALVGVCWFLVASYTRTLRPLGAPKVFSQIDAPEVLFLGGRWDLVRLAPVTAVAVAAIALTVGLFLAARRYPLLAVLVVAGATLVNVVALQAANTKMADISRSWYVTGPQLVRDAGVRPGELVVCDGHVLNRYNMQREVYWRPMPMIDLRYEAIPPDTAVVVALWKSDWPEFDWDGSATGWRVVAEDPTWHYRIWRRS
jgi:hypothetical protein